MHFCSNILVLDFESCLSYRHRELESILSIKGHAVREELNGNCSGQSREKDLASVEAPEDLKDRDTVLCSELIEAKKISLRTQESLSVEAANSLLSTLREQLLPFDVVTSQNSSWEAKSVAVRLANKIKKAKRNKLWRKRKRKRVAEGLCKVLHGGAVACTVVHLIQLFFISLLLQDIFWRYFFYYFVGERNV